MLTDKKRAYITKEEASSLTVATESLMMICIIDAFYGRDVATVDISGAFMQADTDDIFNIKIQGIFLDVLIRIDPDKYMKIIGIENNKKLYMCDKKKR